MKLKFCIVDNSVSFTGAFKCALTAAQLLSDSYEFIFIVPEGSKVIDVLKERSLSFYTLPMVEISRSSKSLLLYGPLLLQNTFRLKHILKKERVAVLQVNDFYNLLGAGVKWLHFGGQLITYVRFLPSVMPAPLRKLWIKMAQKYSTAVIAVSDAVLHQLPPHPCTLRVYDALSLSEQLPQKTDYNKEKVTFLYLANYIRGKGQDLALKAFAEVVKQNRNVALKFTGGDMGLEKNKSFKAQLQQFVASHHLENAVVFESFEYNIEKIIKEADVLLNFSEAESFSMTCAEASYYGIPVIATRCGGPEEIIEDNHTGILVGNRNIQEMYGAMYQLASSPALRERYGKAGRQYVRKKFSADQYLKNIEAVLHPNRKV